MNRIGTEYMHTKDQKVETLETPIRKAIYNQNHELTQLGQS